MTLHIGHVVVHFMLLYSYSRPRCFLNDQLWSATPHLLSHACPPPSLLANSYECGGEKNSAGNNAGKRRRVAGVKKDKTACFFKHNQVASSPPSKHGCSVRAESAALILIKPLFWKTPRWRSKRQFYQNGEHRFRGRHDALRFVRHRRKR